MQQVAFAFYIQTNVCLIGYLVSLTVLLSSTLTVAIVKGGRFWRGATVAAVLAYVVLGGAATIVMMNNFGRLENILLANQASFAALMAEELRLKSAMEGRIVWLVGFWLILIAITSAFAAIFKARRFVRGLCVVLAIISFITLLLDLIANNPYRIYLDALRSAS